jgi:hypothetical protein
VTARSATDAWAVGSTRGDSGASISLVEHWDGTSWTVQQSPDAAPTGNALTWVSAASASSALAVGFNDHAPASTIAEKWDGTSWSPIPSPGLNGADRVPVAATSATNAWAAGDTGSRAAQHAAIVRWNGTAWTAALSPASQFPSSLSGIAATSGSNAWAVGFTGDGAGGASTLIEHWNGSCWRQVPSP